MTSEYISVCATIAPSGGMWSKISFDAHFFDGFMSFWGKKHYLFVWTESCSFWGWGNSINRLLTVAICVFMLTSDLILSKMHLNIALNKRITNAWQEEVLIDLIIKLAFFARSFLDCLASGRLRLDLLRFHLLKLYVTKICLIHRLQIWTTPPSRPDREALSILKFY